jgi:AcrR family transcriptional regulator
MVSEEPQFRSLSRDERRERIVWAAKMVFFQKGLDASSMDDVAAQAGTTKPTIYAHFKSKDELFSAAIELVKRLFLGKLRDPEFYSAEPVEAVTLFCGRFLELVSWRDAIGFQRVAIGEAVRSPANARVVYDTWFAQACKVLAGYLRSRELTSSSELQAELLLSATTSGSIFRHLYGVDLPRLELPDETIIGEHIDFHSIREAVKIFALSWKTDDDRWIDWPSPRA